MTERKIVDSWEEAKIEIPYHARGQVYLRCPECSDGRSRGHQNVKPLSVHVEEGVWHCHHCDYRGKVRGMGSGGATHKKEYILPPPPQPVVADDPLPQEAIAWFAKRGITEAVVREAGVIVTRKWFPQEKEELSCLAFPYFRDGVLVNVKYRVASKKLFRLDKDAEPIFYGIDDCGDDTFCVVVEGEMDKLACRVAGIKPVLSVPNGAPPEGSKPNLDYFESGLAVFDRATKVIIATDGDGPGRTVGDELARRIGLEKCYRVQWPDGTKDANDVLLSMGQEALWDVIADAKAYPVAGIYTVDDFMPQLEELYDGGMPKGFSLGIPSLEDKLTIHMGYLTVVTGIPSHGKSEVLDQFMVNLAEKYHLTFGVFSSESQPLELHTSRLIAKRMRMPFFEGPTPRMNRDNMRAAASWVQDHFHFILPEEPSLDEILSKARLLVQREGINGLVLDPWNTIENNKPKDQQLTEYIGECLLRIQNFARNNKIHIWLVAHPRKMNRVDRSEKQPVPDAYDIADSAHFYNRADTIIVVWRDIYDPGSPVQVHVIKARWRGLGQVGVYTLRFDPITGRYTEWAE